MKNKHLIFFLGITILMSSCLSYKQIVNFQDGSALGQNIVDSVVHYNRVRIKTDDILSVGVFAYNQIEADRFNAVPAMQMAMTSGMGGGSTLNDPFGYQIDKDGNLDMPILGRFKVSGLTIEEVRNLIFEKITATKYVTGLSVQVRFLTFRITVLGEVNAPGTYNITSQDINVLEALGLASDLTVFSNRSNILVIREIDGKNYYGRLDLRSKSIFENPFYKLKPDDILYVEPHRNKTLAFSDPVTRYMGVVVGVISLGALLVSLFN